MGIFFYDDLLLFDSGALAMDADCCCGDATCPCCAIPNVPLTGLILTVSGVVDGANACHCSILNDSYFVPVDHPGACTGHGSFPDQIAECTVTPELLPPFIQTPVDVNAVWTYGCSGTNLVNFHASVTATQSGINTVDFGGITVTLGPTESPTCSGSSSGDIPGPPSDGCDWDNATLTWTAVY